MTPARPHPDLWYAIAQLLAALRQLLRITAQDAFAAIALDARAWLAAIVRRYIHILAVAIMLPPRRMAPPTEDLAPARTSPGYRRYLFPLIETPACPRRTSAAEDAHELQWALLMETVQRLVSVLANPVPTPCASRAASGISSVKRCATLPSVGPFSAASAPKPTRFCSA